MIMSFEFLIHKTWHLRASCISASCSRVESIQLDIVSSYSKWSCLCCEVWREWNLMILASCWVLCGCWCGIRRGWRDRVSGRSICPTRGGAVIVIFLRVELRVLLHTVLHTLEVFHTIWTLYLLFTIVETRKGVLELLSTRATGHTAQTRAVPVYITIRENKTCRIKLNEYPRHKISHISG